MHCFRIGVLGGAWDDVYDDDTFFQLFFDEFQDFRTFVVQQHANMCSTRSTDHFEH